MMVYEDSICVESRHIQNFNWSVINFWISTLQLRSVKFRQHIRENRLKAEFIQEICRKLDEIESPKKYVRIGLNNLGILDWEAED